MRHKVAGKHLGRTSAHRRALRRNLVASLFEHGTISTTREKAKFVKPFAEKLVTLAKDGSLHARRRAIALLQDRNICKIEDGEPVKVDTVISRLFSEIGPRFSDRNGGYTRIVNVPLRRIGDNGQLVLLQLVSELKKTVRTELPTLSDEAPVDAETTSKQTEPAEQAEQTDEPNAEDQTSDQNEAGRGESQDAPEKTE